MKKFSAFIAEDLHAKIRKHVFNRIENSNDDIDTIKASVAKKFGKEHAHKVADLYREYEGEK